MNPKYLISVIRLVGCAQYARNLFGPPRDLEKGLG